MNKQEFWSEQFPTDLYLEKFYRWLGQKIAHPIKPLLLTPNQVTSLRIPLIFLFFLLLISSEKYFILFILMVLLKILDKVDGALARAQKKVTRFGGWIDAIVDRIYWALIFLGLAISVWQDTQSLVPWLLLFIIIFGHFLFQDLILLNVWNQPAERSPKIKQRLRKIRPKQNFLYQIVSSFYYHSDQVVAFALLFYQPARSILKINLLLFCLASYALFFSLLHIYMLYIQYKALAS